MKIKICGLKRIEDINYVNEAKPDYAGFVFAASCRRINAEQAAEFRYLLDKSIKVAGVFADDNTGLIERLVNSGIIDIVQLHGNEDNAYISKLRGNLGMDIQIIKAVSVKNPGDLKNLNCINSDYILLDNGTGGTGTPFDWSLTGGKLGTRIFLAGGINTENIEKAVTLNPYCIDVSSGAETEGVKDREKILKLVRSVRNV